MLVDLGDVRRSLENDELTPCFQPVVELHTGQLKGFEVLARWRHPEFGLILPENFIALAEENGLIGLLSLQMMRKAFQSAAVLPEPLTLAVNVSPTQLRDLNLPAELREAAEKAGFPIDRVTVEITENALINNLERAKQITRALKAIGCTLSLDDFGTGYSSLLHLQSLAFDVLKIDRSFVGSMNNTRESRKIVAAIVGLGQSLGLMTVGEGIETEEQAEMLLCLGCRMGQGWLFGYPLPSDQIPAMIAAAPRASKARLPLLGHSWVGASLEAMPVQRLAQLQAIYDGAPVGLCFLDRNLCYVSINRRLADMNGSPADDHIGRTTREMIPQLFPAVEKYILQAMKGAVNQEVEVLRPPKCPGEEGRTMVCTYQPAFDESGEVIGVSVAVVDITERKRVEEALRESEDHLRHMVELNPEIPWVMDSEGNNLDTSSRWTAITGLSKEHTRNLGWLEALHPDDVGRTMKALQEGLRSGKTIDIEYRVKSLDRGWRWMRSRGSPRIGRKGQIVRWYGSVEDIDERKQLQEALRKSRL